MNRYDILLRKEKAPPKKYSLDPGLLASDDIPCPHCKKGKITRFGSSGRDRGQDGEILPIELEELNCTECKGTGWVPNPKRTTSSSLYNLKVGDWIQNRNRKDKNLVPYLVVESPESGYSIEPDDEPENEIEWGGGVQLRDNARTRRTPSQTRLYTLFDQHSSKIKQMTFAQLRQQGYYKAKVWLSEDSNND